MCNLLVASRRSRRGYNCVWCDVLQLNRLGLVLMGAAFLLVGPAPTLLSSAVETPLLSRGALLVLAMALLGLGQCATFVPLFDATLRDCRDAGLGVPSDTLARQIP